MHHSLITTPSYNPGKFFPKRSFVMQWLLHGLAMAALGGVISYQLYNEYGRITRVERDRLMSHARIIGENLSRQLDATHHALLGIRADSAYWRERIGAGQASQRLATLADAMPGVRTITVLNADGRVVSSNRADLVGENFGNRPYFETARRLANPEMLVVSPPFRTSLGVFAMNLVMMIPGPEGEFAGIVSTTLDPGYFTTLLRSVLYAPDMWVGLVHGDGLQFLMVPDRPGQAGKNLLQPGSFFTRHRDSGQAETMMTGTVYATGEERMMAQITIRPAGVPMDRPLVAGIGRDLSAIHASWREDALKQAGFFFLLLFVSTAGLFYTHRRQQAFDRNLTQTAQALEEAKNRAEASAQTLAVSERFTRAVADNLPGMIAYWDTGLQCRFANKHYLEWFGRTAAQMLGLTMQDLMGERLFALNEPFIRGALRGDYQAFERTLVKTDGSTGYTWAQYLPDHDESGLVKGFFVLVTDVTALKLTELRLKETNEALTVARDKADAANRAKSEFLAMMSHEIRTPITGVLGMADLLRQTPLDEEQTSYLDILAASTNTLLTILNDVLDISKIEAGKVEFEAREFGLHDAVLDTLALFKGNADAKGLALVSDVADDVPRRVMGDPARFKQLLFNLTSNAIKFTASGGVTLRVSARPRTTPEP